MSAEPVYRPWRKILRVSVRALVLLILVVGIALGWIVRSAHIQRDAVAAINGSGGSVSYDWEWRNRAPISGGKPWAPQWLVDRIGVDYFGHVTLVSGPSSMTPAGEVMAAVGQLPQVQYLDVDQAYLTDADLVHLRRLTDLRNLSLSNGQITDAGMENLEGLTKLSSLSLQFTRITDAGLIHLKPLANLSSLGLAGTAVTDAGMVHLKGLARLSGLDLRNTQVSDAAMEGLQKVLPDLQIVGMTH